MRIAELDVEIPGQVIFQIDLKIKPYPPLLGDAGVGKGIGKQAEILDVKKVQLKPNFSFHAVPDIRCICEFFVGPGKPSRGGQVDPVGIDNQIPSTEAGGGAQIQSLFITLQKGGRNGQEPRSFQQQTAA